MDTINQRKIVQEGGKYYVKSEDGSKTLGGPYDSEEEAKKRLEQVEYFKNKGEKSLFLTPERRLLSFAEAEIRVRRNENGEKHIVGYAAVFDKKSQDLGGFIEKIDKKAFDQCMKRNCDVRALKNHDPTHLLGRTKSGTLELEVDERGLRYDIAVPETVIGRDTVTEIERGDLDGSSFSFTTEDEDGDEWDDKADPPVRTLRNIRDLFDVGPVTYPAYLDTEVKCRSLDRLKESRARERQREEERRVDAAEIIRRHRRLALIRLKLSLR
jgi:HK97 family phage prohead protease